LNTGNESDLNTTRTRNEIMNEKSNISQDLTSWLNRDDPYEDINTKKLPDWWERNIRLFSNHKMKTYRPPLLEDGTLVPDLRRSIESKYDVDIKIQSLDPKGAASWGIYVDGSHVLEIERYRNNNGQVIYKMDKETFKSIVFSTLSDID
jgi:hypothetical protein